MRPDRFVDTSGWAAWARSRDPHHKAALDRADETSRAGGRLVTTNWVLVELVPLFVRMRVKKADQFAFFDDLHATPTIEVEVVDPPTEAAAWARWRARPDKDWSVVDCASFVVMERRGLTEAVTADHHFEQAGFVRLLK
ncbi:MAG: PIN domain-containing protein [Gemmataceae bacterium]|nr:PIN domain-containing protein [Gemmataceae bacterium]